MEPKWNVKDAMENADLEKKFCINGTKVECKVKSLSGKSFLNGY